MTNFLKFAAASSLAVTLAAYTATAGEYKAKSDKMGAKAEMTDSVMVGGAEMFPNKTIVENASEANNLTTLVALVKQAQLVDTLSSPGPFTVFAPTDDAFSAVPESTRNALMMDENRTQLQGILTYHVVSGKITAPELIALINANGGSYTATTVAGGPLTFSLSGGNVMIKDAAGGMSTVIIADVMQSNGVVHAVDTVLMPG